jgi:hypothetical protein
MGGVNLSNYSIPESTKPLVRKKAVSLREHSDEYKNPEKTASTDPEIIKKFKPTEALEFLTSPSQVRHESVIKAVKKSNKSATSPSRVRHGDQIIANPRRESVTSQSQVRNKSVTDSVTSPSQSPSRELDQDSTLKRLVELSKNQKTILDHLYDLCAQLGERTTPQISNTDLEKDTKINKGSLKNNISILNDNNILFVKNTKYGPSGWRIFEIPEITYRYISGQRTTSKLAEVRNESITSPSRSPSREVSRDVPSSSSINITTTNYKADALAKIELTESLTAIGFNQGHIEQLLRDSSLSPDEIQNSLNAFAFDLGFEDVKRKVRSPIGLIMKLLKNGQAYVSEKGYESEEDRLYRELIERADKKNEEKKNLKARLVEVKFEEWLDNISDDDKRNMAEPIGEFMGIIHRQELKEYFKREVYNANNI